jgi:hypothetical protein
MDNVKTIQDDPENRNARGMPITNSGLIPLLLVAGADGRLLGGLRQKAYLTNFR